MRYYPQLDNLPQFNTTIKLEGLNNIVQDISWQSNSQNQHLAPSLSYSSSTSFPSTSIQTNNLSVLKKENEEKKYCI